jgi:hypothetical protein
VDSRAGLDNVEKRKFLIQSRLELLPLMKFDVSDNIMAALSSVENQACRVQQKTKKQQLTVMDVFKK